MKDGQTRQEIEFKWNTLSWNVSCLLLSLKKFVPSRPKLLNNQMFLLHLIVILSLYDYSFVEKKEEIWLTFMTQAPTPMENSKKQRNN